MQKLNRTTANLPANKQVKIIQFGGGNFLRGFVDWMVDELNKQTNFNGGVLVIKPTEKGDYTALRKQDGLFHLLTRGIREGALVAEQQLIQCIQNIIHPYQEWNKYLKSAEIPSLRFVVSNTTEAGIQFSKQDTFTNQAPKEFPAKLTCWLYHRWQFFSGDVDRGCIHLPCELIEQNGHQLKKCILQYVDLWKLEPTFKDWIRDHNYFCNTLVDRIVPGFPDGDISTVYQELGFEDNLIVSAEPYHIWVIEGEEFIKKELPFEQTNLNVVFTNNLEPYRQLKVRILNGAHTTMVPIGYLSNIETVRTAVEDEKVGQFLKTALYEEILPTLDFPQAAKEKYMADVLDRFKNPYIHHQLISIALNATSKYKTRVLPSLLRFYKLTGTVPPKLATALAALITFYRGKRNGHLIPIKDSEFALSFFQNVWKEWNTDKDTSKLVRQVLKENTFWGQDINKIEGLAEKIVGDVNQFIKHSPIEIPQ